jgi:hypothetical protein
MPFSHSVKSRFGRSGDRLRAVTQVQKPGFTTEFTEERKTALVWEGFGVYAGD